MIICLGSYLVGFNLCDIVVSGLMSRVVGSCPVCFRQGCSILKHRLRHINRKQCETCSTWGAFFSSLASAPILCIRITAPPHKQTTYESRKQCDALAKLSKQLNKQRQTKTDCQPWPFNAHRLTGIRIVDFESDRRWSSTASDSAIKQSWLQQAAACCISLGKG